ncbi:unnamed protein product [Periconia digitata]|uniref:G-protein coupled receptors family 2 profile 2 domain-containing protein n=1 Tax=Periconia digitata TaxID=1303443 RepID=A0A9W4UP11_9PLEO|nr:unnamed protein product [Periconia digitata]
MPNFSDHEMLAIKITERTMSTLSIIGSIFIITTFLKWHYFRKPINRLVFYASFGNLTVNAATFMGTSAIPSNSRHLTPVCEFQGILIQWWHRFMAADSLWVFSMALNVQLVFFRGYTSAKLRHLEKWYFISAYGIPGITAIVYIFMDHLSNTRTIGPATLWCWVSADVDWMRIAFFYAPIWFVIICTLGIYMVTGLKIFRKGSELHSLSKRVAADRAPENILQSQPTSTDLTIKVETTMETHFESHDLQEVAAPTSRCGSHSSFGSTRQLSGPSLSTAIEPPSAAAHSECFAGSSRDIEAQSGYRATAFATDRLDTDIDPSRSMSITNSAIKRPHNRVKASGAAWGYFKVALLMFLALVCVWVPSTVNRLQQFIDKEKNPKFSLNLASALVLPLQGFWNSMIYISTTWPECKRATAEILEVFAGYRRNGWTVDCSRGECRGEPLEFGAEIPLGDMGNTKSPRPHRSRDTTKDRDLLAVNVAPPT